MDTSSAGCHLGQSRWPMLVLWETDEPMARLLH